MMRDVHYLAAIFAAAVALSASTPSAQAQHFRHGSVGNGEFIVNSQVISDEAVGGGYGSGSYVGDIPSGTSNDVVNLGMIGGGVGGTVERGYGKPDLFYNFYTQGRANRTNAQMYLSPVPVPPNVGHTFNTYQPFYPHHMLYWHKDRYHNYYDNGRGMNRTRAVYYSPPVRQAVSNFYWNYLRIPR